MSIGFVIRKAHSNDSEAIYELISELALFEKAPQEVANTIENIKLHGWGDRPVFHAWVAELQGKIVGMAICYIRYSTWKGPVLFLEDLIVTESCRGKGMGKALFETCAQFGRDSGYPRMNWQVLDWNQPAIDFYEKYGAQFDAEWLNCSLILSNDHPE